MSRRFEAVCIPVTWHEGGSYFLAYYPGWSCAHLYDVIEIYMDDRPKNPLAGYRATVDNFGNLVRVS
jgi:hypothetical protein